MMRNQIQVLGISGSLRRNSYNTAALRYAKQVLPEGMSLEIFDLSGIPFYNADVEASGLPDRVRVFKERIATANALLIATPEYNYSIPGVLKNAIDWASRPAGKSPLNGKPVAIMGATTGAFGTVRAQMHLRQVCLYNDMHPLNKPEVLIMQAKNKFDEQGRLTDETTQGFIRNMLVALKSWALTLTMQQATV